MNRCESPPNSAGDVAASVSNEPSIEERLAFRTRPSGSPIMHQNWGKLLFKHWPIEAEILRPLIPAPLTIDTFDGQAWIGVVPFTMWGIRASFLPPIPGTSAFHELNVRTYVHFNGEPGVWFFSLDAANRLAVWGARTFYHLPYFNAEMALQQEDDAIKYSSARTDDETYAGFFERNGKGFSADFRSEQFRDLPRAKLNLRWRIGGPLAASKPGSIEFFLTERYCLYAYHRGKLGRSRIWHKPWPLCAATVESCESTMLESLGIAQPSGDPLLHYAESIAVDIWPLKKVSEART